MAKHKFSSYSKEKGDPAGGTAGAEKENAETDNLVIGGDKPFLKSNAVL